MFNWKAFQDGAVVLQDVGALAAQFADVPPAVTSLAVDAWALVRSPNLAGAQKLSADICALKAVVLADDATAAPLFDKLEADVQTLLADLS